MLRNRRTLVAAAALLPLSIAFIPTACSGSDTGPPSGSCTADLASIEANIFAPSCAKGGCHSATQPAAGLNLAAMDLAGQLVGVDAATCNGKIRVAPGDPDGSFLYEKINSSKPACGDHMPLGVDLSAEQKACIKDWIASLPAVDAGADAGCETCGGSQCVDLQTDPAHCGGCSKPCPPGAGCAAGACACAAGLTTCGATCSDTTSDPLNCGGCGKPCAANEVCNLGVCSASCGALTKCGAACVDTNTSLTNCGVCGKVCAAGLSCIGGACKCAAGSSDCGGKCIDTTTDANNCGGCGKICAVGQTCMAGACTCGNASVSFAAAVQPIFTSHCASAGCHTGVMPQQGLNLGAGKAYAGLVNVAATQCNDGRKRVLPGQPSESYLIDKLMGVDLCFGTKMPKLGMLPSGDIMTVVDWICEGAPNN